MSIKLNDVDSEDILLPLLFAPLPPYTFKQLLTLDFSFLVFFCLGKVDMVLSPIDAKGMLIYVFITLYSKGASLVVPHRHE